VLEFRLVRPKATTTPVPAAAIKTHFNALLFFAAGAGTAVDRTVGTVGIEGFCLALAGS